MAVQEVVGFPAGHVSRAGVGCIQELGLPGGIPVRLPALRGQGHEGLRPSVPRGGHCWCGDFSLSFCPRASAEAPRTGTRLKL